MQVSFAPIVAMKTKVNKNLQWPPELDQLFDSLVGHGLQWHVLSAAVLMFAEADELTRERFLNKIASAERNNKFGEMIAPLIREPLANAARSAGRRRGGPP